MKKKEYNFHTVEHTILQTRCKNICNYAHDQTQCTDRYSGGCEHNEHHHWCLKCQFIKHMHLLCNVADYEQLSVVDVRRNLAFYQNSTHVKRLCMNIHATVWWGSEIHSIQLTCLISSPS